MIIDTHTHISCERDYQEYLARANGKVAKIFSIYFWSMEPPDNTGRMVKIGLGDVLEFAKGKENFFIVGAVNMDEDISVQITALEELLETKKIVGVKLYPGYQHFYPSDQKVYPIAELCQRYNKPLLLHTGDFYDTDGHALLKYAHPIHVDELAARFPKCKMVIAHFGFPYHLETANIAAKHDNVYTEISGTIVGFASEENNQKLLRQYADDLRRVYAYFPILKEKTMFGTDFSGEHTPLNQVTPYIELVERVFSEKEQPRVFHQLADELFFAR